MQPIKRIASKTVVIASSDIDTDQIIPARFLTTTTREGLGKQLFADWRYQSDGSPKGEFVLNRPEARGAEILVTGRNFGCGSSREHAPWALLDYGFRSIIAPSFADIFYNNCFKNGMLPVRLPEEQVDQLFGRALAPSGYELTVDLERQWVTDEMGLRFSFDVDPFRRLCLLKGLDDIGLTLQHEDKIREHERHRIVFR
jgi:3-isopropylmalate/(R)-2-methylmalate dehydratase small subunit